MNHEVVRKFKALFESQKLELAHSKLSLSSELIQEKDEMLDEFDLCAAEMDRDMKIRMAHRQGLFVKKLDQALAKIQAGTFGCCEECEEEIELKRLEARPTATLCLGCKESREHLERQFA